MPEFVYKIKMKNNLYSLGGQMVFANDRGKIWKDWAHLKLHLGLIFDHELRKPGDSVYKNAKAVTYYMVPICESRITNLVPTKSTFSAEDPPEYKERVCSWPRKPGVSYSDIARTLREEADRIEQLALSQTVDK